MSEIEIAKVAEAIWHQGCIQQFGGNITSWVDLDQIRKGRFIEQAKAAIEAMRGPTEEMRIVGGEMKSKIEKLAYALYFADTASYREIICVGPEWGDIDVLTKRKYIILAKVTIKESKQGAAEFRQEGRHK